MYLPLKRKLPNITSKIPPIAAMAVILLGWEVVSISGIVPSYMLPSPVAVLTALFGDLPTILFHAKFTLLESFYGLLIGIAGICVCNYDGSVPCNGSGILSDHDHYADHTDHCHCANSGALDGIWNGTEDHSGCDHHFFQNYNRPAGWI